MHRMIFAALAIGTAVVTFEPTSRAQSDANDPYAGKVAKASNEWKKTLLRMQLPSGVKADLWAAEPHVANIVAFHFDEKGRCYVAETFRLHRGVTDNRNHPRAWTDDDLACMTVGDRVAMYKKHLKGKFPTYEQDMDRVRMVEDSQGTGRADRATILADGFKNAAAGLGSGVLARQGKIWYTCIPELWLLQDTKGTGRADVKKSLHTGYGIRTAFLGHDMHGLRFGPDGRLYFSIGDRGLHVETGGKVISNRESGAVLRCNPDGSELELFATGLRNPQELAFDEYGNLFTGDNNADGGDQARWVHVVEGGDSGWRMAYQYLPSLGVWNSEKLWHTQATNTASYLLPPLAHIGNGPSGLTYHPGTSLLPEKYDKHFFLCDFRGSGAGSGIHAFQIKPKGASFEVVNRQQFVWSVLATDCDFGPDGGFYLSDWVEGWGMPNKGRIYKLFDPKKLNDPAVREVKTLLAEGFSQRPVADLVKLLEHKDQRVRQEAQFALVDKGALDGLLLAADKETKNRLARLHGIWGLGQVARVGRPIDALTAKRLLIQFAEDADADVRAQALSVLVRQESAKATAAVIKGLQDPEPRVRFHAGLAAGRLSDAKAVSAVLEMLRMNSDIDPYLRHAGVMALVGIGDRDAIRQAAADNAAAVRLAALLAMRRLGMSEIANFLTDSDRHIVVEAARAIHDAPISDAMPNLADRAKTSLRDVPDPAVLRILAANHRLGGAENASIVVAAATRSDISMAMREQALKMLQAWDSSSGRDWVVGRWRPVAPRTEASNAAVRKGIADIGPSLRDAVADRKRPSQARVDALLILEAFKDAQLDQTAKIALAENDPRLRHQARRIFIKKVKNAEVVPILAKALDEGHIIEQQGALALLASVGSQASMEVIEAWVDQLVAGNVPAELKLDILLAATKQNMRITKKLAGYEATRNPKDSMSVYREALVGGDAEAGRKIFFERTEVSCLRCHKVNGVGGEVGPDLTGIGKKQKRDYLLEAIVDPNKQIAKGYETLVIELKNGQTKIGVLKSEDAKEVRIMTAEGQLLAIPKTQIEERSRGPSAMPSDLVQKMSRREVRDLVEFLANLQ